MKKIGRSILLLSLLLAFLFAMPGLTALASSPGPSASSASQDNASSNVVIHTTGGKTIGQATQNQTEDLINAIGNETGDAANTSGTWLQSTWETIKGVWVNYIMPWIVENPVIVVIIVVVLIVLLIFHKRR